MTSTNSTKAYRASGMLRRILRLEASPAFKPDIPVRWMKIDWRPKVPIARNEHWVIDVLDDAVPNPNARWRRTTDPNDHGVLPPGRERTMYYHFGFNPDENVIYEDEEENDNKDAA